ncbi:MAG: leucine-rich repeat domain-containing protein, partial [Bacteroidales bacterium]|nr:leucine-rich repeat domain-containing protein [Bacteroidales bacterium]
CNVFSQCSSVKAFDVSKENKSFCSEDGVLFTKDKRTLIAYTAARAATYDIPAGVDSIGDYAFYFCNNLTTLTVPDGVTSIGESSFQNCTRLSSFTLPGSLTSIAKSAFMHCRAFTSVAIPTNVTTIDSLAFKCCKTLTEIVVAPDNSVYSSLDGVLLSKDKQTLLVYPNSKSATYILPDGVHSIAASAFDSCLSLTSVTIPADITDIGSHAFEGCTGLTSIRSNNVMPPTLDSSVFSGVYTDICTLYVPTGSSSAYTATDQWSDFVHITEEVTSVPQTTAEEPTIYRKGDLLVLDGVKAGTPMRIYTENGILLHTVLVSDNIVRIPLQADHTYLISLGGKTVKVR